MENKDAYTPEEVKSMMLRYAELSSYFSFNIRLGIDKGRTDEENLQMKDIALRSMERLLHFERETPQNIKERLQKDLSDLEEAVGREINRR